jgi:hypothetical protein
MKLSEDDKDRLKLVGILVDCVYLRIYFSSSSSIRLLAVPQPCRLIVLARLWNYPPVTPRGPRLQRRDRLLAGKRESVGEKWPVNLPTNGEFHAI